jgi:serine protease Do
MKTRKKNLGLARRVIVAWLIGAVGLWNIVGAEIGADALSAKTSAAMLGKVFAETAKNVKPAVVYIETVSVTEVAYDPFALFNDEFARRFFGMRGAPRNGRQQRSKGMGSGFLISADGLIVTNAHVVKGAEQITIKLADGTENQGAVVGADETNDVALVKIEGQNLPFLEFGDSDAIEVGEWVLAVGNPFGLAQTVTSGIVSAKGRSAMGLGQYEDFIQTDAAINPGNSGGPLVNLDGQVIGLNTAIFSKSGGYMGIGFAAPSNAVAQVTRQLRESGQFTPGYFGALVVERNDKNGVMIETVLPKSPAQKAGLRIGDVILTINGRAIADRQTFNNLVGLAGADAEFKITFRRDEQINECVVKLQAPEEEKTYTDQVLGLRVRNLTGEDYSRGLPLVKGVLIVESSPLALNVGLTPGTIISEINGTGIETVDQYHENINAAGRRQTVNFRLYDQRGFRTMSLRLR